VPAKKRKKDPTPNLAPPENNQVRRPTKPVKKKAIPAAEGKGPVATTSKVDPVPAEKNPVRRPSKPVKKKAIPAAEGKAPEALVPATSKVEPVPRRTSPRYSKVKLITIPFLLDIRIFYSYEVKINRLKLTSSSTMNERPREATKKLAQSIF